jgi:flagellar M-ring protein FliF
VASTENSLRGGWGRLGAATRVAAVLGVAAVLAVGAWLAAGLFEVEYRVLFSDLAEADAGRLVERLRDDNTRYRLAANGTTILVPVEELYDTRLALMSGDTPLMGGVGFEIFDEQSLGATEQSQRVSYQRALQGELARTIATLDNVKQARVHLVLPDSTLFKRDTQEPQAAVTLALRTATPPSREQIIGVQRLVAASVAGLEPGKVVIVDQTGITLSGVADVGNAASSGEARLTTKREVEEYLTHKVAALLDDTYGPGKAIVSVDVALNFDEITRTVQDLLPVRAQTGEGRVLPRLQVSSGVSYDDPTWAIESGTEAPRPGNSTSRVEYEYGRRVEQVIAAPGGITRVSIGVVIPIALDASTQDRIREMVKVVAGIDEARGDEVVVRTLAELGAEPKSGMEPDATVNDVQPATDAVYEAADALVATAVEEVEALAPEPAAETPPPVTAARAQPAGLSRLLAQTASRASGVWPWVAVASLATVLLGGVVLAWRTRGRSEELSATERQRLLAEIRRALGDDDTAGAQP